MAESKKRKKEDIADAEEIDDQDLQENASQESFATRKNFLSSTGGEEAGDYRPLLSLVLGY